MFQPIEEIHAAFARDAHLRHREIDYCRFRWRDRRWLRALLYRRSRLFRRLTFEAIETHPR